MATQYFNDLDVGKINDNIEIASHENEEFHRAQFAPNVKDTHDLTEPVDKNVEGRSDDFPLIKDVTSEAVWHDVSENDASLKDKEERLMATNCAVEVDSGSNNKYAGTNALFYNAGDKAADADYRDGEITPPPPLPLPPPQQMTLDAAPQPQPSPFVAPSVVSESQLCSRSCGSAPAPVGAVGGCAHALFRGFAIAKHREKVPGESSAISWCLRGAFTFRALFLSCRRRLYSIMLQSVVSVSIRSPEYDYPDDDDDGDHLRVGTASAYLGGRDRDRDRRVTVDCPFAPGDCSRCGSRSRSASPRYISELTSREASPFAYSTRIIHRRGSPRRRRRTSTKVRRRKTHSVSGVYRDGQKCMS